MRRSWRAPGPQDRLTDQYGAGGTALNGRPGTGSPGKNDIALLEPTRQCGATHRPHVGVLLHIDLKRLGRMPLVGHGDSRRPPSARPEGRQRLP